MPEYNFQWVRVPFMAIAIVFGAYSFVHLNVSTQMTQIYLLIAVVRLIA